MQTVSPVSGFSCSPLPDVGGSPPAGEIRQAAGQIPLTRLLHYLLLLEKEKEVFSLMTL